MFETNNIIYSDKKFYAISEELAEGYFARVYQADPITNEGTSIAVKELKDEMIDDAFAQLLFMREQLFLSKLNHPHAVRFIDNTQTESYNPYYCMELLGSFNELNLDYNSLLRKLLTDISSFLEHLEDLGYVHGDIKPSNIGVATNGKLKVLDFGTVRRVDDDLKDFFSSETYEAPEFDDARSFQNSDVYSFGRVIVEYAIKPKYVHLKQLDYRAQTPKEVVECIEQIHDSKLPDSLRKIIEGSLQEDPGRRLMASELLPLVKETNSELRHSDLFQNKVDL